jgi:DNA helicase HerA-like ATPase
VSSRLLAPGGDGLLVTRGSALDWHRAGDGTVVEAVPHVFATREIVAIGGAEELGAGPMRSVASALLSGAACMPGVAALELRYLTDPSGAQPRVRMYVTAKSVGDVDVASAAADAACAALPRAFSWGVPQAPLALAGSGSAPGMIVELHRYEEITGPQWDFVPTEFYYTIDDEPGDGSGWAAFWALLGQVTQRVEISLLFSATELDPRERDALARITTDLSLYGHQHHDYDVFGNPVTYPADANALIAYESWSRRIAQLGRPLLGRIAVRGAPGPAQTVAAALVTAIGAVNGGERPPRPMYVEAAVPGSSEERSASAAFDWLEIAPWGGARLWETGEAPRVLRRVPYLYGIGEAAGVAVLPVPDDQGVPGFPRSRRSATRRASVGLDPGDAPGVAIGELLDHGAHAGELRLPLSSINRHVLIAGASGSGKTTTVLTLLAGLWRDHGIPFLVIEPIKREYRSLLETPGMRDVRVICLGRDDLSPLRLNPLAPPPGVRREVHAGAVMAALKLALPLFAPLPQLLDDALDRTYELAGWGLDTTIEDGVPAPSLRALLPAYDLVIEQEGYVGEARNLAAALRVRLKSLLRGSRGRVLDTVESVDFDRLLEHPVVIELDEVVDGDEKALLSAFVLERLRAAARGRGTTGRLAHVTVLEEAHRLLGRAHEGRLGREGGDDTRAQAVRSLCEAIRELRAQGEGFVISTQSPADLARAALATTGTRVLHRIETADDRDAVLDDLAASELDREAAARLRQGEAIARWPEHDEAELLRVLPAPGIDSGRTVADATVAAHMAPHAEAVRALLPHRLCTRAVCTAGCVARVREEGQSIAAAVAPAARARWRDAAGRVDVLEPLVAALLTEAGGEPQPAYCGAVHLAVTGDAFDVRRPVELRRTIAAAITRAKERA